MRQNVSYNLGPLFDTGALCCGQHVMYVVHVPTSLPRLDHHCTLGKPNANRNHLPPSLRPSAPYDDLAAVPTSSSSLRRALHLLLPLSSSHLRRLGQWRRRGRRGAANGSASRAQNEGSRVKTNDFYFGNQSEEERAAAAGRRTAVGRWRRVPQLLAPESQARLQRPFPMPLLLSAYLALPR